MCSRVVPGFEIDLQAGLALEVRELELRLRVDGVDLTATNRLDLGIRVRPEDERHLVQVGLVRPIPTVVPHHRDGLALHVALQDVRACPDVLPGLVLVALVPGRVEVHAREGMGRVDRQREQDLPRSVRLLEDHRHRLPLAGDALDRIPAAPARNVVLGIDLHAPGPGEVLAGHLHAVAPDRLRLDLEAERERALPDDLRLAVGHVGHEREVGLLDVHPAKRGAYGPRRPGVVAPGECTVQARRLLLGGEDHRPASLGRLRCSRRAARGEDHRHETDDRKGRQSKSMHTVSSPFESHRFDSGKVDTRDAKRREKLASRRATVTAPNNYR